MFKGATPESVSVKVSVPAAHVLSFSHIDPTGEKEGRDLCTFTVAVIVCGGEPESVTVKVTTPPAQVAAVISGSTVNVLPDSKPGLAMYVRLFEVTVYGGVPPDPDIVNVTLSVASPSGLVNAATETVDGEMEKAALVVKLHV
jgi:hypothetical protein